MILYMDRVLYIGKFQPFHNGHRHVVEKLRDRHDELIVAIGGAGKSHQLKNPYTAGERIQMIYNTIDVNNSIFIISVPDINSNKVWPSHVEKYSPEFDTIYTNNPLVTELFNEFGKEVNNLDMIDREKLSGTNVRQKIINNNSEWEELVPETVKNYLYEINGLNRIQTISKNDKQMSEK